MSSYRHFCAVAAVAATLWSAPHFALATVSGDVSAGSGSVYDLHLTQTAAPLTATAPGATASLQFSAGAGCSGLACYTDGPAISAHIDASTVPVTAGGQLFYTFDVVGGNDPVPILVSGIYATALPDAFNDGLGGTFITAAVRIRGAGPLLYEFRSLCFNYIPERNEQGPEENCGSGTFNGSFSARAGTATRVQMLATIGLLFRTYAPDAASAFLDPFFQIDPTWAVDHPGYSLVFDQGVGNGMPGAFGGNVAPVPEPETFALIALGLASMAWVRRRRAHASTVATAKPG